MVAPVDWWNCAIWGLKEYLRNGSFLGWFVVPVQNKIFLFCLGCTGWPSTKFSFPHHTIFHFIGPHIPVVPRRLSLNMWLCSVLFHGCTRRAQTSWHGLVCTVQGPHAFTSYMVFPGPRYQDPRRCTSRLAASWGWPAGWTWDLRGRTSITGTCQPFIGWLRPRDFLVPLLITWIKITWSYVVLFTS